MKKTGWTGVIGPGLVFAATVALQAPAHAAGQPVIAPLAHVDMGESPQAKAAAQGLEATLTAMPSHQCGVAMAFQPADEHAPASCSVVRLAIRDPARPQAAPQTFLIAPHGPDSGYERMEMALYRLDATSTLPQVIVSAYTGGAHCCEVSSLFGQMPDGTWKETDLGQSDGDGTPTIVDAAHDGRAEIQEVDPAFLYTFASYAGSYPPLILKRYHAGQMETVTRDPAFRPYLARQLAGAQKEWLADDRPEPNGFLAYYVATKAELGEFGQGWQYMLKHAEYRTDDMFGISACDMKPAGTEQCTPEERKSVPFPQALAYFLQKNGYITPEQASAAPMTPSADGAQDSVAGSGYRPDFSCDPPPDHNGVAVMLCHDSGAARHELLFDQVYYALRQQVGRDGWKALRQEVIADENAADQGCGLPVPGAADQDVPDGAAACYAAAMDRLTERYRQRLGGTALEEARRPLDTHIALQRRLVELGYLPAGTVADGVYGEATREAIATWQRTTHRPETDGFVSDAGAQVLLPPAVMASAGPAGDTQPVASAAPAPVATTPATTAPAHRADLRLFGFGIGVILVMAVFGTCLYFLPFGIACLRDSTGKGSVFAVNFFFGWTLLGWVAALVMALSFETRADYELRRQAMIKIVAGGSAPDSHA